LPNISKFTLYGNFTRFSQKLLLMVEIRVGVQQKVAHSDGRSEISTIIHFREWSNIDTAFCRSFVYGLLMNKPSVGSGHSNLMFLHSFSNVDIVLFSPASRQINCERDLFIAE
jgi:hypothetical protein